MGMTDFEIGADCPVCGRISVTREQFVEGSYGSDGSVAVVFECPSCSARIELKGKVDSRATDALTALAVSSMGSVTLSGMGSQQGGSGDTGEAAESCGSSDTFASCVDAGTDGEGAGKRDACVEMDGIDGGAPVSMDGQAEADGESAMPGLAETQEDTSADSLQVVSGSEGKGAEDGGKETERVNGIDDAMGCEDAAAQQPDVGTDGAGNADGVPSGGETPDADAGSDVGSKQKPEGRKLNIRYTVLGTNSMATYGVEMGHRLRTEKQKQQSQAEYTPTDEDLAKLEYFHRQLESLDTVDEAIDEIDTGYNFTDEDENDGKDDEA